MVFLSACEQSAPPVAAKIEDSNNTTIDLVQQTEEYDAHELLEKIIHSQALLTEIKVGLSQDNVTGLVNIIHALYAMRWNRNVQRLLNDMWLGKTQQHPELAWEHIQKPPVRIALASTMFRINSLATLQGADLQPYKSYMREHRYAQHEFNQAQAVVGLGLAGDPADIPYLAEMASGDNFYIIQTAISALGFMDNKQASEALIELYKKYVNDTDTKRAALILDVLGKSYQLYLTDKPPQNSS